jgi:predicted DNA-binding transcriptional regulator AlpA
MSVNMTKDADRYLRLHQVIELVPVSKSTIWRWIRAGAFPGPAKSVSKIRLWSLKEVLAWMALVEEQESE